MLREQQARLADSERVVERQAEVDRLHKQLTTIMTELAKKMVSIEGMVGASEKLRQRMDKDLRATIDAKCNDVRSSIPAAPIQVRNIVAYDC